MLLLEFGDLSLHQRPQLVLCRVLGCRSCVFCHCMGLLKLALRLGEGSLSLFFVLSQLFDLCGVLTVNLSDLIYHFLLLVFQLLLMLSLLLNKLLDELVSVLTHPTDGILVGCDLESQLTHRVLLLLELPRLIVHL